MVVNHEQCRWPLFVCGDKIVDGFKNRIRLEVVNKSNKELRAEQFVSDQALRRSMIGNILDPTCRVNFHLLHLVRVEFLFNSLRQRGRQATPCGRLTPPIIDGCRERIIDR